MSNTSTTQRDRAMILQPGFAIVLVTVLLLSVLHVRKIAQVHYVFSGHAVSKHTEVLLYYGALTRIRERECLRLL